MFLPVRISRWARYTMPTIIIICDCSKVYWASAKTDQNLDKIQLGIYIWFYVIFVSEIDSSSHNQCSICFDADANAAVNPCGHVMCYSCASEQLQQSRTCPMCRGTIETILRLYTNWKMRIWINLDQSKISWNVISTLWKYQKSQIE